MSKFPHIDWLHTLDGIHRKAVLQGLAAVFRDASPVISYGATTITKEGEEIVFRSEHVQERRVTFRPGVKTHIRELNKTEREFSDAVIAALDVKIKALDAKPPRGLFPPLASGGDFLPKNRQF